MLTFEMAFYTYLLASKRNGTFYAGHTDDLRKRISEHKANKGAIFTRKYAVHLLVWFETHETREGAKTREYQIKKWRRAWKLRLVEEKNPDWRDLYLDLNNLIGFD